MIKVKSSIKWAKYLQILIVLMFLSAEVIAQTTIGGKIYSGRNFGTGPAFAPATPAIAGAKVLVQNQHSGGAFITYGTVSGNSWTATVPNDGDYVVMFSAPGHDLTSREVAVDAFGGVKHPKQSSTGIALSSDPLGIDAYLPPLYTKPDGTPDPAHELPLANLLVFAFYDNYVNGEPDGEPQDLPLNGVTFTVKNEEGVVLATGVTGTQATITTTDVPPIVITDTRGLYYFEGLPPGEVIVTSDPSTVTAAANPHITFADPSDVTRDWYLNYTEEGGPAWDPKLYPGDPGTEDGGFMIWHSYVEKLDDFGAPGNPNPTGTGKITGYLDDADKPGLDPDEPFPVPGEDHPGVSLNEHVADGLVILFTDDETIPTHPVATAEADPVTGYFEFNNVPAGSYKMMMFDVPLDYVWTQVQLTVAAGQTVAFPANALLVPRFFARGQGFVYDKSTGLPMPGSEVHIRFKSGSIQKEEITDATGWYNFDDLPEIEVMGYVDVAPPPGYRGAIITETFYPYGKVISLEDANMNGILDPGEDGNGNGVLDYVLADDGSGGIDCAALASYWGSVKGLPLGVSDVCIPVTHNASNRYIQWLTANYRADLYLEPIPAGVGHIDGYVFNDHFSRGSWTGDGVYDPEEERTFQGVTVNLYDATGTTLIASTTTGAFDEAATKALGWHEPYTWPPDELGGVFVGPQIGYYEFRDVAPGTYVVKVVPPAGFSAATGSPVAGEVTVVVTGSEPTVPANGDLHTVNFGINTTDGTPNVDVGSPLAGEIEGGVFDDVNIDPRGGSLTPDPTDTQSLLWMEKAGIPDVPVGVYDHLGYLLGVGIMGNPLCYAGAPLDPISGLPQCPAGADPVQKPEMERRFAPGVHIYVGNDPAFPKGYDPSHPTWGYCPNYLPLVLPYTFGQGKFKFEADWSLIPVAVIDINDQCAPAPPLALLPGNAPVINNLGFAALDAPDDGTRYAFEAPQQPGVAPPAADLISEFPGRPVEEELAIFSRALPANHRQAGTLLFASAAAGGSLMTPPSLAAAPVPAPPPIDAPLVVRPGDLIRIHGQNFGDREAYFEVLLSGEELKVRKWTDTYIDVVIDDRSISGGIVVATSTGISNAKPVEIDYEPDWARYLERYAVYVDASNIGAEDGSKSAPWNTITEALDHLPDTGKHKYVIVAPGTYHERLHIKNHRVHLVGFGPQETIINGLPDPLATGYNPILSQGNHGYGPVIHIGDGRDNEVNKVSVSGFTITGGTVKNDIGAGIFLDYGGNRIDINSNIIVRNGGYYGGGIWGHYSNHELRIHSNVIAENGNYGGYGGGISINDEPEEYSQEHGQPEHIVDDLEPGPPPGVYKIYNNLIYHNYSPDYGAAITMYEIKDHLRIYGNMVVENKAEDHGGAVFFEDCGPVNLYNNVFLRNICFDDGGAVSFEDVGDTLSHVEVYNNLFAQNIADDRGENHARGGALAFDDTFYGRVYNNTIVGNIVAGSFTPAGGAIDSERNGHEYNGTDGPAKAPGYSNPQLYNNIIYGNWRLNYDQPGGEEEDLDYTFGVNYRWTPDELHVDNPALQPPWESYKNSESFTDVFYNDIRGGYSNGSHNVDLAPGFVDPSAFNWRLSAGSPVIDQALYRFGAPEVEMDQDLEKQSRKPNHHLIDMGAFEWHPTPEIVVRIPVGILGTVRYPVPGSPGL